ncbi:hypothetical protein [Bacteroides uniformis]|uniref:hypothetical protein n=1 Tax=Bacteroides TaxID=816 RepID=UPI003983DC4E
MHLECLIPDFGGLQILYLQAICKGYLQAHNSLCFNGISAESLQMADKMRKKTLCSGARKAAVLRLYHLYSSL